MTRSLREPDPSAERLPARPAAAPAGGCVVVGGGQVAHRRVAGLLEAGAQVTVVSPEVTPALEALVGRRLGHLARRAGTWTATWPAPGTPSPPPTTRRSTPRSPPRPSSTGSSASAPTTASASSVWTPAVGRHGDLVVGVHGGGDPQRAVGVRDAVAGRADRRLASPTAPPARRPAPPAASSWSAAGPGDPGLITVRGRQAVAAGRRRRRRPPGAAGAAGVAAARRRGHRRLQAARAGRSMAQEQINALLVERALAGQAGGAAQGRRPVRLRPRHARSSRPASPPASRSRWCPASPARSPCPALAGIPVTHRGLTHEFVVVSGHVPPGHPQSLVDWAALGRLRGTLVVLMGVDTAPAIAAALIEHGRDPETPVAVVTDGSTPAQRTVRTTLAGLAAHHRRRGRPPPGGLGRRRRRRRSAPDPRERVRRSLSRGRRRRTRRCSPRWRPRRGRTRRRR